MIEAARRAAPIVATGLVAVGCLAVGYSIGEKRTHIEVVSAEIAVGRFQKVTETTALDTKTGQTCNIHAVKELPGFTNDVPNCVDLAKQ